MYIRSALNLPLSNSLLGSFKYLHFLAQPTCYADTLKCYFSLCRIVLSVFSHSDRVFLPDKENTEFVLLFVIAVDLLFSLPSLSIFRCPGLLGVALLSLLQHFAPHPPEISKRYHQSALVKP
ncbi:hypothetical protein CSKR_202871 [Clonorchis sinensis]|uniref:Uncharacterized protein n=1 Tax=Clonorchis sinensis TaxID=79923 RepID=A0A8T1M332_CLOSI|nr:hypothetical protein CSKR_202871 [Clonorchis sinensis]